MKKGFTLHELLISMAIVGIVAALTAPAIMDIMPDQRKAKYLKAYNTLTTQTSEILDTAGLYYDDSPTNNDGCTIAGGLICTAQPLIPAFRRDDENDQGLNKFFSILARNLNLAGEPNFGTNVLPPAKNKASTCSFTTADGTIWAFTTTASEIPQVNDESGNEITPRHLELQITVTVDTDSTETNVAAPRLYTNTNTNPDCFQFVIANDGGITPANNDYLGQAYLETQSNLKNLKADLARAKDLWDAAHPAD